MGHKNRKSLNEQIHDRLQAMEGFGRSKHRDKLDGIQGSYIYSFSTMKAYLKHCRYFAAFVRALPEAAARLGHKPRTLDECRQFVPAFLQYQTERGLSPYTLKLEASALHKLYGETFALELPRNSRAAIKRSRGEAVRDRNFSLQNNVELVNFCRCCGPRRSELEKLSANSLRVKDGRYYISYEKGTKGGKPRLSPITGTPEEVRRAVAFCRTLTGKNHVHSSLDVHSLRAEYASRVYREHARPLEGLRGKWMDYTAATGKYGKYGNRIWKPALYVCRKDRAGVVYDREALLAASRALGHNREDVVAGHYLYQQEPERGK